MGWLNTQNHTVKPKPATEGDTPTLTIAKIYIGPFGTPLYWRNELTGRLSDAIHAYLANRVEGKPITPIQTETFRAYLEYYIDAPCWKDFSVELKLLRLRVRLLRTPEDIQEWIRESLEFGLDPL